jgi:hypothetical protein
MSVHRLQEILNVLHSYSLKENFSAERKMAQDIYFIATGTVYDDDPFYEDRLFCFQEFFLFEYRLSDVFSGSTVFETFLYNAQNVFSRADLFDFERLRDNNHSIYRVLSGKEDSLIVKDLISLRTYKVYPLNDFSFAGFDEGQIFEGRRIFFENKHYFTKSFVLHSKKVNDIIEKKIKNYKKSQQYCSAKKKVMWKDALYLRSYLVSLVEKQKSKLEASEKIKSVELLNVTKTISQIPKQIHSRHLVMSLGEPEEVSPFVPETSFYSTSPLIYYFAYCDIKKNRYKHIDPSKIYDYSEDNHSF